MFLVVHDAETRYEVVVEKWRPKRRRPGVALGLTHMLFS
jgi:hypothetical protein